jgi:hypothetical protein
MEEKDKEIVKQEECIELKNIKYKTMLLNGNPIVETKSSNNLLNLDKFLEDEKNNSKNEPWSKLNKTIRTQKVLSFVESYKNEKKLNEEEEKLLLTFLKECLDKKRLTRVKDVIYDKVTGNIKEIPALFYNKSSKHFTLKNLDKRVSTLKSLPANKHKKSLTNTSESHDNDNDSEDKLFV